MDGSGPPGAPAARQEAMRDARIPAARARGPEGERRPDSPRQGGTVPSKSMCFVGGVVGAVLPYAAFYARHSDVIQDVRGAHGTTGLAMAGGAALGVALVGGLLAAVVSPARFGVAFLLGVLVAAGVFVAGIPQFGKTQDGTRPKTEPVWVAVTPVSMAVDHAVRSAQGAARSEEHTSELQS